MNAPIAIFIFKRPEHTRQMLKALANNSEFEKSEIIVFCDGPRDAKEKPQVEAARKVLIDYFWHPQMKIIIREVNMGLSHSIIGGVSEILKEFDRVIVIEDDLITSPHFLRYMNDGLNIYSEVVKVASIHGYVYPVGKKLPETFFLRGADCWGWATWRRAWAEFKPSGSILLEELRARGLTHLFDLDDSFGFTNMLEDQVKGRNDSWAVRWHASTFLKEMFTLYPGRSLVANIGNDATGTHHGLTDDYNVVLSSLPVVVERHSVEESQDAREAFKKFNLQKRPSRFLNRIKRMISF
jgi:hypothetical protein